MLFFIKDPNMVLNLNAFQRIVHQMGFRRSIGSFLLHMLIRSRSLEYPTADDWKKMDQQIRRLMWTHILLCGSIHIKICDNDMPFGYRVTEKEIKLVNTTEPLKSSTYLIEYPKWYSDQVTNIFETDLIF